MSDWTTIGTLALGCVVVLYITQRAFASRNSYPLPPGPPGLPWVGNIIGIDAGAPWKTYAEWARTYGDIVYSRLFGNDIIIINSEKIAKDLLENRSRNYSDRPCLVTAAMCGLDFHSTLLPYGNRWRLHRRFFHQTFRLDAVPRFLPLQHRKACHLLRRLFDTPEEFHDHMFEYTASVILNSTFDYDPASRKDKLVGMMADALNVFPLAARPDISIVAGAFPLLLRLPPWFPGMSFKSQMEMARVFSKQYLERPFEYSLQKVPSGSVAPSMVHDALRHAEDKGISPEESWMQALKEASGSAFVAASETSNSVLMTFFLMMVLNPAAQETAQVQIDAVVGKARLPTMEDRPLLPFVDAIYWETLRSSPVLPLSVPHVALDDDMYGGFHIPKGAMLIANLWSMAHDDSRYPNPHAFIPERFLNDDGSLKPNEIEHITFGFGRRICVGRHFADTSVWAVIAKVLAVFKILKSLDENGVEILVEPRFSSGLTIHPLPFGCKIVPRFPGMDAEKLELLIAASTP
ncbi:cytochrome P450 [Butyriboletus roseoflavus]|nr:cytochrome P450 [Butyriboletus roseoflavus]